MIKFKRCSKCGEIKSITEFHKNKSYKDGLCFSCKKCILEYHKKYYQEHKKEKREYYKKYCQEHRKEQKKFKMIVCDSCKKGFVKKYNCQKYCCQECAKKARLKKQYQFRQTKNGKFTLKIHAKKYYENHKEKIKEHQKQYRRTNKGKKVSAKAYAKRKRNLNWIKLYDNPFTPNIKIHWHHINNTYVVALPLWLHVMYNGNKYHRINLLPLVLQIYPNLLEMLSNKLNNKQK